MKKQTSFSVLLGVILIATGGTLGAQHAPRQATSERQAAARERVETAEIAFLTHKLKLTSAEAQRFWPVYEAFRDELKAVDREPLRGLRRVAEDPERWSALTEKEAEELMRKHAKAMDERERIRRAYHTKFLEVLPAKKVLMLYVAEAQFREAVMDRLRERQGPPPAPGGGGRPAPRGPRPGGVPFDGE